MKDRKKIILTGGHLSPLLAVYDVLRQEADVAIIGRKYTFEVDKTESLEYSIFKNENVDFFDIDAPRLQRKYTKETIPSFFKSPQAISRALTVLQKEKPDSVLIFGGYIGIPVALAAYIKKIPIVIHEQTLAAGLANRIIGKFASKICISFPDSKKYFNNKKIVLTGNPVRKEVFEVIKEVVIPRDKPILYITGGSTGAHAINLLVSEVLDSLLEKFNVIHQTGDAQEFKDFDVLSQKREELPESLQNRYILRKFILPSEIGWIYKNSDVVLSRAGINTVTELLTLSKKALLIPLPHGQKNEQLKNAKMYQGSGLGIYIAQEEATPKNIMSGLEKLMSKKIEKREEGGNSSAEKIAEIVLAA